MALLYFYYLGDIFLFPSEVGSFFFFLLKLGVFPFAGWYVYALSEFSLPLLLISLTVQKLPSLLLLSLSCIFPGSSLLIIFLVVLRFNIFYCSVSSFSVSGGYLSFV